MRSLKYFLNRPSIHAPSSHLRLCLSLSILLFKSVNVGDHFDMHLEYLLCIITQKMKQTHKIAFFGVFAGSTISFRSHDIWHILYLVLLYGNTLFNVLAIRNKLAITI